MKAAVLQMVSGPDVLANLEVASALIADAASQDARLVVLPENFAYLGRHERDKLDIAEPLDAGPIQRFLGEQAGQNGLWLIGGSIALQSNQSEKVYASCLVFGPDGQLAARYDKLHLFDVALPGSAEQYRESDSYLPGETPQLVETGAGRLGLSICYDLRFPELYRGYARQGAELFSIPSAFTQATGEVHWELLLRARAVENLAYVLAANQGGKHPGGRETFGGSMIVDPWGTVLARLDKGPGVAVADIDLDKLHGIRHRFPALDHRRPSL